MGCFRQYHQNLHVVCVFIFSKEAKTSCKHEEKKPKKIFRRNFFDFVIVSGLLWTPVEKNMQQFEKTYETSSIHIIKHSLQSAAGDLVV